MKKSTDKQETSVLKGESVLSVGKLLKNRDNVKFSAGTATIGIRGTDIEGAMIGDGQDDRAGSITVHDGLTEMQLETGETAVIEKEKSGFTPKDPKRASRSFKFLTIVPLSCGLRDSTL